MSNEFKLNEATSRALRARALLDNELLAEAFATLEQSYAAAWRATVIDDMVGREKLFLAVNVVGKVRDHLTFAIENGKLAAAELKSLELKREHKKRFGLG